MASHIKLFLCSYIKPEHKSEIEHLYLSSPIGQLSSGTRTIGNIAIARLASLN